MSLHDLMLCVCGHPRHAHVSVLTETVDGHETLHDGLCRRCDCKGFLERRRQR